MFAFLNSFYFFILSCVINLLIWILPNISTIVLHFNTRALYLYYIIVLLQVNMLVSAASDYTYILHLCISWHTTLYISPTYHICIPPLLTTTSKYDCRWTAGCRRRLLHSERAGRGGWSPGLCIDSTANMSRRNSMTMRRRKYTGVYAIQLHWHYMIYTITQVAY